MVYLSSMLADGKVVCSAESAKLARDMMDNAITKAAADDVLVIKIPHVACVPSAGVRLKLLRMPEQDFVPHVNGARHVGHQDHLAVIHHAVQDRRQHEQV